MKFASQHSTRVHLSFERCACLWRFSHVGRTLGLDCPIVSYRIVPGDWISSEQRGFLQRRPMLSNVSDVEEAALQPDLEQEDPEMSLLDVEAAFPLINWHAALGKEVSASALL